jgi:hypothetical protein
VSAADVTTLAFTSLVSIDGRFPDIAQSEDKQMGYRRLKHVDLEMQIVRSAWSTDENDVDSIEGNMSHASALTTRPHKPQKQRSTVMIDEVDSSEEKHASVTIPLAQRRRWTNLQILSKCRVLHICARAIRVIDDEDPCFGLQLPPSNGSLDQTRQECASFSVLTAAEVVQQLFLRHCGMVLLSRFGITDDISDIRRLGLASELVDSFLFAGAQTVVHSIWSPNSTQEHIALQLLLLHFLARLPAYAAKRAPVAEALRAAQLWLKSATPEHIFEFLSNAPLPLHVQQELTRHVQELAAQGHAPGRKDVCLFSHPLYWASLQVVGAGKGTHAREIPDTDSSSIDMYVINSHQSTPLIPL